MLALGNMPVNESLSVLAGGLAAAHVAYGRTECVLAVHMTMPSKVTLGYSARILFVVQDGERNVFDQRWLEYELLEK